MTAIEWTDATWNPTTGCDRVSPGCDHCYALGMAKRLKAMGQPKYQADGDPRTSGPGFGLTMHHDTLDLPLRWRKPRRVFVNSMSDLFHPRVTYSFIAEVFAVMAATPQHTYQILTKRPKRMRSIVGDVWGAATFEHLVRVAYECWTVEGGGICEDYTWPLPNVWLGVSVEDQQRADERIPALLDTPAAVRFLSCEPLLGPVDLRRVPIPITGPRVLAPNRLDWVIVGGESGPGARPMHLTWARTLVQQCQAAGTAVFVKQLGAQPYNDDHDSWPVLPDRKGGDWTAWPDDLRVREYPAAVTV